MDTTNNVTISRSRVETLARLYLEGDSLEISDTMIIALCSWLLSEFQKNPLDIEFSWHEHFWLFY